MWKSVRSNPPSTPILVETCASNAVAGPHPYAITAGVQWTQPSHSAPYSYIIMSIHRFPGQRSNSFSIPRT